MPKKLGEVKANVIHLRLSQQLSLREIHCLTGVPKSTLSGWLKPYPLSEDIRQEKQAVAYKKLNAQNRAKPRKRTPPIESKFYQVAKDRQLTASQKGVVCEAAVLFRLALHGFKVYGSPFDGGATDWVVENANGKLLRLQVKSVPIGQNNAPKIAPRCSDGRGKSRIYKNTEFDFLVGYCLVTDTAYVFSFEELKNRQGITCLERDAERWDKLL